MYVAISVGGQIQIVDVYTTSFQQEIDVVRSQLHIASRKLEFILTISLWIFHPHQLNQSVFISLISQYFKKTDIS